jgi:LEA14-like dessication related protein
LRDVRNLILLTFFFLLSCAPGKIIARPEWQVQGIRIEQLDFSKATLGVDVQMTNPNSFGVTVKQMNYRLYFKEALIAQGEKNESFELPGHGVTDVPLPLEIALVEVRQILPLLKSKALKEDLNWRIEGECLLKAFGIEKRFPFKEREKKKS